MEIILRNTDINPLNLAREIGYTLTKYSQGTDLNFVRNLGRNNYPRFHIYVEKRGEDLIMKLHLDQKASSYQGSHAHNAEYEGKVVEKEVERIKRLCKI